MKSNSPNSSFLVTLYSRPLIHLSSIYVQSCKLTWPTSFLWLLHRVMNWLDQQVFATYHHQSHLGKNKRPTKLSQEDPQNRWSMSHKIVAIKKLKTTMSIPALFFGAKFCKNTRNFLRLIDELQNCCHQEVENYYKHSFSSSFWCKILPKYWKLFEAATFTKVVFGNFCKNLF